MSNNENSALDAKLVDNPPAENSQQRLSEGILLRGKLFGVEDVKKETGDDVCQDSMVKLKAILSAKKESKQRICIKINLEGIEIIDEKTNTSLYKHSVNRISYIARDIKDSKAIGYIYKTSENSFQYFGLRTIDQAQVVFNTLKDLFEVVLKIRNSKKQENDSTTTSASTSPPLSTATTEGKANEDFIKKSVPPLLDVIEKPGLAENKQFNKDENTAASSLIEVETNIPSEKIPEKKTTDPFGLLELSDLNTSSPNPIISMNFNENIFQIPNPPSRPAPTTPFNNPMITMNPMLNPALPSYMSPPFYQNPNPLQTNTGFQSQVNPFGNAYGSGNYRP